MTDLHMIINKQGFYEVVDMAQVWHVKPRNYGWDLHHNKHDIVHVQSIVGQITHTSWAKMESHNRELLTSRAKDHGVVNE